MRRADLLALTGLTSVKFNNMVHRGQVPFDVREAKKARWTDYTTEEAIQLALVLAFADHNCPLDFGSAFVRDHYTDLKTRLAKMEKGGPPIYFGFSQDEFDLEMDDEIDEEAFRTVFAGSLNELGETIEQLIEFEGLADISGLLIVNVTAAVRRMVRRARRAGRADAASAIEAAWGQACPD